MRALRFGATPPVFLAFLFCLLSHAHLVASDAIRHETPLTDQWLFQIIDSSAESPMSKAWETVDLPHTWNIKDGAQSAGPYRRGLGIYQRSFRVPENWQGRSIFLTVGAANAMATVNLNGQDVGDHRTGFTAFVIDLTPHLRGGADAKQDLQITVDNRNNLEYPPLVSDYTFFGGIHRQVWLTATDPVHIGMTDHSSSGVYLIQKLVSHARADVEVQVVVSNDLPQAVTDVRVAVDIITPDGVIVASVESDLLDLNSQSSERVSLPVRWDRPRLWDGRRDPFRYTARVRTFRGDRITDEKSQPLGVRSFSVEAKRGFFLNGRSYPLHGPSLHQDHAGKGWAISDADRALDVALLKEIGATCVRLVHYPHAPATLNLLDEAGIIAWAEVPIAYRTGKAPEFEANCRTMLTEMICQLYNHPSILFWGLHNEMSGTRPDSLRLIQGLHDLAKQLDPNRLTTGSVGAIEQDPICDVTDLVAFNRYFGWFIPGAHLMSPWAESSHELFPDRCIGLAEYGGEGDPSKHADWRTRQTATRFGMDSRMGTEEYQTQLHEELWLQLADTQHLWCKMSWVLADWASGGKKVPSPWPSDGVGKMGFVTYDRKLKKDVFYWYKANWSSEPVLYIAERRFIARQFSEFDLRVYSNLKVSLSVTINGLPLVAEPEIHGVRHLWSAIKVKPGKATVVVTAKMGDKIMTDTVEWEFPDVPSPPPQKAPEDMRVKPEKKPGF